jgi:hypothetical protein
MRNGGWIECKGAIMNSFFSRFFGGGIGTILRALFVVLTASLFVCSPRVLACPFCTAESQTLSEETQTADVVVLAKLLKEAKPADEADRALGEYDPNAGAATFEVIEALSGGDTLAGAKEIEAVYFGEFDRDRVFLISGVSTERIDWMTPLPLSPTSVDYVRKLGDVPASGAERLAFFQEYLENDDPLLAQDAYDEFARAPYADVQALAPKMHHDRLVKWISDPEISPSRRRLYLTMLGACGTKNDLPMLESLIKSDFKAMKPHLERAVQRALAMGGPIGLPLWIDLVDQDERRKKLGLDALVACYLTLGGPDGLDLIDDRFLKNPNTEYTYIYSTIMALRFHGEEPTSKLPRERLLASMRLLLDNPEFADQVIPDLARWEDWSVLDRLVAMFKSSDKNGYVRQPVVTYLTVASEQPGDIGTRAQTALTELEQIDPEGVKQARALMAFGALGRARASSATNNDTAATASSKADDSSSATAKTAEGLAASPAEIKEAEEADPADFADPESFSGGEVVGEPAAGEDKTSSIESNVAPSSQPEQAAPSADAPSDSVSSSTTAAPVLPKAELNTLLAVGVPLAAAALLMGIYWFILRIGAV